jgi:hypothetical protein
MARSTDPFRYFDSSPELIRLVVMMYDRYPLTLHNFQPRTESSPVRRYGAGRFFGSSHAKVR